MKIYGLVLAALTVVILGAKVLQAGSSGQAPAKNEATSVEKSTSQSERDMLLRWQQNRAVHWRAYVMQQP